MKFKKYKKYKKYKLKYINLKKQQKNLKGGSNYEYLSKFGSEGNANGQFNNPRGIVELTNGDIIVSDTDLVHWQIFDSNGVFKSKSSSAYGRMDSEIERSKGTIVLDNNKFAICDSENIRVEIFDSNAYFIKCIQYSYM